MPDSYDFHNTLLGPDSVHDPARSADDLPDTGVVEFGDDPPGSGKIGQMLDRVEHILDEAGRCSWTGLSNVGSKFSQIKASGWSPD